MFAGQPTSSAPPSSSLSKRLLDGQDCKSARREFFYYDETDLMAIRSDPMRV
jgi:hypothetical protein